MTCLWTLPLCAGQDIGSAAIRLGFVNLSTARAPAHPGESDTFVGGVVVRLFDKSTKRESFVITDGHGVALVPLRVGNYCAEAYGTNARKLRPDTRLNRSGAVCFALRAEELKDVGVTIASDEDYKPVLPPAGVR